MVVVVVVVVVVVPCGPLLLVGEKRLYAVWAPTRSARAPDLVNPHSPCRCF